MDDGVLQAALALPEEDRRELAERIRESLVSREEGDPGSCPRCGCSHVVRRGRDADGAQRWLCRGCGRTFTARTGGLVALSKLPLGTWLAYVDATLEGASLRGCAKRCSVSLPTSWYMRMRLCDVMGSQLQGLQGRRGHVGPGGRGLPGRVAQGPQPGGPHAPRAAPPRRRVRVPRPLQAQDRRRHRRERPGDCFCSVASRGKAGIEGVRASLAGVDLAGSRVATDRLRSYIRPLRAAGVAAHNRYNAKEAGEDELGMVNALHSRLRGFLSRFNGVSTRRLALYLLWFEWLEQARRSDASRSAMLSAQAANGRYGIRRRALFAEPRPFWGYWRRPPVMDIDSLYPPEVISGVV